MPSDEEEAAQIAAVARAGLWALFAAATCAGSQHPNATGEDVAIEATEAADKLLANFNARFPIEEMLLP
jgi:hypothetical protein